MISFLYALLGSVSAISAEALYFTHATAGTNAWLDLRIYPLIIFIPIGVWGVYTHSPKFFGAAILFTSANLILRIFTGTYIIGEKLTWNIALGFGFILLANYFIKK